MTQQEYLAAHLGGPAAPEISRVIVMVSKQDAIPRKEFIQDITPELEELVAEKELIVRPDTLTPEQLMIEATALK